MRNSARPSTPVSQSVPATPQSGTWRHPRLDEIVRRQNASNFSEQHIKNILYNAGGIVTSFYLARCLWDMFPTALHSSSPINKYAGYLYYLIQLSFLYNILIAFLPLLRTMDNLSDIPLTPAQRKLLGLPPSSVPPTPGSTYSTPPRYGRTPTPISGSPANKNSASPLSGTGSPASGSPFSAGGRIGGGLNGDRRYSYGSPLGSGSTKGVLDTPGTPTPSIGKGGIGLNSKWLYDKGRRNSGSSRLYT